ncbi:MAG: TraR/DksA family transcriptional regulator [Carbonactinosporaceae bacterium]
MAERGKGSARKPATVKAPTKQVGVKQPSAKQARTTQTPSTRSASTTRPRATAPVDPVGKVGKVGAVGKVAPERLAVRPEEEPWTRMELREVRGGLETEIARLRTEISEAELEFAELLRDSGDSAGDDQADAGNKTFEREHEMSLAKNSRDMLLQTERALDRIEDGTYGVCESCGNPIGKARLQAFPRATLCVGCKQREERR